MNSNRPITLALADEAATARLAAALAARVGIGDILALSGPLGAGKTSFARAFIRSLGEGDEDVPSPTFTLVETYAFPDRPPLWHFDLYRLNHPEDVYELGIEEAWAEGVSLIEWPERIGGILPRERLDLQFSPGKTEHERFVTLTASDSWRSRLGDLADG